MIRKDDILKILTERGIERAFGVPVSKLLKKDLLELYEGLDTGVPRHLSPSQIEMYRRCPMQYHYRYQRKMTLPPKAAMTLGSSVDSAVNVYFQEKLDKGDEAPLSAMSDVFREALKERQGDTLWDEKREDIERDGLAMVGEHRKNLGPETEPVDIQKELVVEFSDRPFSFLGYADLIGVRSGVMQIIDLKTTGRPMDDSLAQVHPQLTAYYAAQAATGETVEVVTLDALIRPSKKNPARSQKVTARREARDAERYWKTVGAIYDAIKAGVFYPAPRASGNRANWVCTPEYCGYFRVCHEEF